jgi:PhnB protein
LCEPGSERLGHAELELGGARLLLADEYPDFGALSPLTVGGTPVSLHLYVSDVDRTVKQAADAGATVLRPVKDEFFGDRTALLVDPFGHRWHLATRKEEVSPEEMQKRWNESMAAG